MTDIMLMPMERTHVSQVAELEKLCFSAPWSERSIAAELDNPLSFWLVALNRDRVVGYVGSQLVPPEADMMNLAVDPAFRRQGVASALVESLTDHLWKKGIRSLTLEVRASNHGAKALYDALGFAQVGRRKNYYFSPREDGLILRKELKA